MPTVIVNKGDDLDVCLSVFKGKLRKEGWFEEMKKRQYYTKPSALRHEKIQKWKAKMEKKNRERGSYE